MKGVEMAYVDTHFHIWDLRANYYPWLTDLIVKDHVAGDYSRIRKNYLISDFLADAAGSGVTKGVHIQAEHDPSDPVRETRWLQAVAADPASRGFPHAIVAQGTLERPDFERRLTEHCSFPNMRGVRQILPPDVLDHTLFRENLALLSRHRMSFDLRVRHPQMRDAAALAAAHPRVSFILTHAGYRVSPAPDYVSAWREGMKLLAEHDNVAVKLSGFGFVDRQWTIETMRPIVLETIDFFGPGRCMFASDFPVDKLARGYRAYWSAYETITEGFMSAERHAMFTANAVRLYRV